MGKICAALELLSLPPEYVARSESRFTVRGVAGQRRKGLGREIVDTVIRVNRQAYEDWRARSAPGTGSPRSPHNRRAHFRLLRSGERVLVRAAKIHGGGPAKDYVVVP